ncbi:MAG: hypothetical protein JWO67_6389 [Streptosporangiaceae bacterium]|nr:hypothetical protein [Streptosporangiaceae bacterium]
MEAFVRAFEDLARAIVEAYAPHIRAFSLLAHTIDYSLRPAWHRRFCTRCRPRRASRPLAIDGHAYRRRQRARRRRARR